MKILVTGGTGFLGKAVMKTLAAARLNPSTILGRGTASDLGDAYGFWRLLTDDEYTHVIHCAYPGANGIGTMLETPADLVRDMLRIDMNVIDVCSRAPTVKKLICIGSVCAYPQYVTLPSEESQLWLGYPEAVNAPYGVAKRMQLELLKVYRRQYGLNGIHLILGNLYGPGDRSGHVIPATIRKVLKAKAEGAGSISVWGDGTATREFLYVDDAARAIHSALLRYDSPEPINITTEREIHIRQLVTTVSELIGWSGAIDWDASKPNGQPRRWFMNINARHRLGWAPQMPFRDGLARTIAWLQEQEQIGA